MIRLSGTIVMQEIIVYKGYNDKRDVIPYWHTYDKKEVDVIIGDAKVAIEIKSTEHVETKHKKGLKAFKEEHPDCRLILVSQPDYPQIRRQRTHLRFGLPEDALEW